MASMVIIVCLTIIMATNTSFSRASRTSLDILSRTSLESLSEGESLRRAMFAWKRNFSSWVGDDPCQWKHVQCNNDQKVISLNLSHTGVQGPIPLEIGNLKYLKVLDLNNPRDAPLPLNQVTGDLSALQSLTNLESLNLSFNNVKLPSFPKVVLTLKELRHLRIDNNYLSGQLPKEIADLTHLEFVYLGNNSMTGPLPKEFSTLVNLTELSLWNNDLYSKIPPEFGSLRRLEYINLRQCNLYGGLPPEFGNIASLKNISLWSNSLTGSIPESWGKLTHVYNLWLHDNYLTKTFPTWFKDIPALTNLSLGYNYFYGSLPNFNNSTVEIVNIQCNFFSGDPPSTALNITFNSSGNCFYNYDSYPKIACRQLEYFTCNSFQQVANGKCPVCPQGQVLEDPNTCVCTLGGGVSKTKIILISVGSCLFLIALVWLMWAKCHRRTTQPTSGQQRKYFEAQGAIDELWEGPDGIVRFKLEDLATATNDFNSQCEIGMGGFGKVFHAVLDGREVAIKRAHLSAIQSSEGFCNEVLLLSRLHHKNLVHLLGFCEEDGIQDPPVIHRDIKPSNILLDDNLVAKLSDFGLSKVAPECETHFVTRPAGTLGYIDPQYILREQLTTASDVYSFGLVLLEVISGQKAIDITRMDEINLVEWVKLKLKTDGLKGVVDPRLGNIYPFEIYQDLLRVAVDCASFRSEERPSMKAVLKILEECRWSVAPYLGEASKERPVYCSDEDMHASDRQRLVRDTEGSIEIGTSTTFEVSCILPR